MKKMMIMAAACMMAAMTFAAQCAATTKKGTQCKRQASPGSEFCWQHGGTTKAERAGNGESEAPKRARKAAKAESEAPAANNDAPAAVEGQCQATTKRGTQCRRKAVEGGKYCAQHAARMGGGEAEAPAAKPKRTRKAKADVTAEPAAKPSEPAAVSGMCQGKSKNGEPCKRKAKPGSNFCWQHEK